MTDSRTTPPSPMMAKFSWPWRDSLPIPEAARQDAGFNQVQVCEEGISNLPAPFNRASCWVYCREAWPHTDPDFQGVVFITIALVADHRYSQVLPNNKHAEIGVFPGTIFTTDPLSLHWLAPNGEGSPDFIGLQYEVSCDSLDEVWNELVAELSVLGILQINSCSQLDSLLVADPGCDVLPIGQQA